jgi:hypothetical protein
MECFTNSDQTHGWMAFAAFILITEVREFNGDVFKVGQN